MHVESKACWPVIGRPPLLSGSNTSSFNSLMVDTALLNSVDEMHHDTKLSDSSTSSINSVIVDTPFLSDKMQPDIKSASKNSDFSVVCEKLEDLFIDQGMIRIHISYDP